MVCRNNTPGAGIEGKADRDACYKFTGDTMVPITTVNDKDYVPGFNKAGIDALLR